MTSIAEFTYWNGSFSKELPGLQIAVDSTSLGTFKECPRKYYYANIMGLRPRQQSVHLTFGLLVHEAREQYEHAIAGGQGHQESLLVALRHVMVATWDQEMNRGWLSDHKLKNRVTLVRSVIWYLDQFGQEEGMETCKLTNGKPAIELTFSFNSGFVSQTTEEPIFLCGHLDRIATLGGEPYVVDIKTTGSTLSGSFFDSFTPGNQFSMYSLAGRVAFDQPVRGVLVDGMQIGVGFTKFLRGMILRSEGYLNEWLVGVGWWLRQMEQSALEENWPQNDKSCHHFGGCQFKGVCARTPGARKQILDLDFQTSIWDPTKARGDV